jgi:replication-associated recombination protein RarA
MQKCIRRGMERDALFWATELDRSNFGEYVWKRLRIIATEDVGLADPQAPLVIIRALYDNWRDQRKKDDTKHAPERLSSFHAVMLLCRADKSRSVDHALVGHV